MRTLLNNSIWLWIDKVIRLLLGTVIQFKLATVFGPESFGILNYSITFANLFVACSNLGLDQIIIRELICQPQQKYLILGTAFRLKLIAGILTLMIAIIAIYVINPQFCLLVSLYTAGFIFQATNVVEFYFQAHQQIKYMLYATNSAYLIGCFLKLIVLWQHGSLIVFAVIHLIEMALTGLLLLISYQYYQRDFQYWRYDLKIAFNLLQHGWKILLSGLLLMLSLRIDQLMISNLLGYSHNGLYVMTSKITETMMFIPLAFIQAGFPQIIRIKKDSISQYHQQLQQLISIIVLISFLLIIALNFSGKLLIEQWLNSAYLSIYDLLIYSSISGLFSILAVIGNRWLIHENLHNYLFIRTALGLILGVFLNYLFITLFGLIGAVLANLILQFIIGYLFDIFLLKHGQLFTMKTRALLLIDWLHQYKKYA
ncbi:MAG: hypothetical protein RL637_788 [Pseudomonadota bacterium]|jgi:PST family polysaccharide transporter